jgi:hypothetical protein
MTNGPFRGQLLLHILGEKQIEFTSNQYIYYCKKYL